MSRKFAYIENFENFLSKIDNSNDIEGGSKPFVFNKSIEFKNVSFSYGNNLMGFIGLDENDNSLENIFGSLETNLTHIFSENSASIYLSEHDRGHSFPTFQRILSF